MSFTFGSDFRDIERDYELVRVAIQKLPGTLGARVHGAGMAAAARVVRNHARANAPFKDISGGTRRSIRARRRSQKVYTLYPVRGSRRIAGAAAQVLAGRTGTSSYEGAQAYILEFGRKPGPGYPGAPPFPFMMPAAIMTQREQFRAAATALRRAFLQVAGEIRTGRARPITLRNLANEEIV